MTPILDPRRGDIEDDASSTKSRSLISLAGSLLTEISLPKLIVAWGLLVALPALVLGLAPLMLSLWATTLSGKIQAEFGLFALIALAAILVIGLVAGRRVFRWAEASFWSLNAVAIQPVYALCREGLRQIAESFLRTKASEESRARVRAISAGTAGLVLSAMALFVAWSVWPATRWTGDLGDLAAPLHLVPVAIANSVVITCAYLAVASLAWGLDDAMMDQPMGLARFAPEPGPDAAKPWRVAHLSDVHVVGEPYGFRIESGRAGPKGNERFERVLERLDAIHRADPLDLVLISGDLTDAGSNGEFVALLGALKRHPALLERMLVIPGNHDLNIVDRANPARLDLPTSPNRRLRQMRTLSAMDDVQGERVHLIDPDGKRMGSTLSDVLRPRAHEIAAFADKGGLLRSIRLADLWEQVFPQILPPSTPDGLGVILLDSNAPTHFSFTNALGMMPVHQAQGIEIAAKAYPQARWIIALHHHLVEYPTRAKAFSERVGTALVNGTWFVRQLARRKGSAIAMHGHRHVDWIGHCGDLVIVSAPSPVMEATNDEPTAFYIHRLSPGPDGRLDLLAPERITMDAQTEAV